MLHQITITIHRITITDMVFQIATCDSAQRSTSVLFSFVFPVDLADRLSSGNQKRALKLRRREIKLDNCRGSSKNLFDFVIRRFTYRTAE
jgi:hypothetical protein